MGTTWSAGQWELNLKKKNKKQSQHVTQSRGTLQDDFFIPLDAKYFRLIVEKKLPIPRDYYYYRHVAALIVLVEPQTLSKSSSPLIICNTHDLLRNKPKTDKSSNVR